MAEYQYIIPYNTEEERHYILTVCREHNRICDIPELTVEVGQKLIQFARASFTCFHFFPPTALKDIHHCIMCGNGGGQNETHNFFFDNNVLVIPYTTAVGRCLGLHTPFNIEELIHDYNT